MERFNELLDLYRRTQTVMSAICVLKGGIDMDNYAGRFWVADLLELLVKYGEASGADITALRAELEAKRDLVTPDDKPIHKMTLAEFERIIIGADNIRP